MRVATRNLLCTIAIIVIASSFAAGAQVAHEHSGSPRTFNVCALRVAGTGGNHHPLIFEALRRFPDLPAGWELRNPAAPPTAVAGVGAISKADPDYWLVSLNNATIGRLQGMDLLYICQPELNVTSLRQREALINAVRDGAVLWIDQADVTGSGTTVTAFAPPGPERYNSSATPTPPPFTFVDAGSGTPDRAAWDSNSWLLRYPMRISGNQVRRLGRDPIPPAARPLESIAFDPSVGEYFSGLISDDGNTLIGAAVAPLGDGAIVVTAGEIGYSLEQWANLLAAHGGPITTGAWWSSAKLRYPSRYHLPDFRFACNLLAASGDWNQARQSAYARGDSEAEVRPPLSIDWQFPGQFEPTQSKKIGPVVCNPVYSGGMVFVITQPKETGDQDGPEPSYLLCFDADPARDLDGDGRADDGLSDVFPVNSDLPVLDYSAGDEYDLIWARSMGDMVPRYASPCVVEMPGIQDAAGGPALSLPLKAVLVSVVDPSGNNPAQVRAYNATIDPDTLDSIDSDTSLPSAYMTPGEALWSYQIAPYNNDSEVVSLSTPVVYKDYVFVLASEFDDNIDGDSGTLSPADAYGRAHCFKLSHRWDDVGSFGLGGRWQMPDPSDNPNNDADVTGTGPADDDAFPELQGTFPPFHDPRWVCGLAPYDVDPFASAARPMLPPTHGCIPVLHSSSDEVMDGDFDACLQFGTPTETTFDWDGGSSEWNVQIPGWNDTNSPPTHHGGGEFCVIPTPTVPNTSGGSTPEDVDLNIDYYRVISLPNPNLTDDNGDGIPDHMEIHSVKRDYNATPDVNIDGGWTMRLVDTNENGSYNAVYLDLESAQAREWMLPARRGDVSDPFRSVYRLPMEVVYSVDENEDGDYDDDDDLDHEVRRVTLRGPIQWHESEGRGRQRSTPAAVTGPLSALTVTDVAENPERQISDTLHAGTEAVRLIDRTTGNPRWGFVPHTTMPTDRISYVMNGYRSAVKSAPLYDQATQTAVIAANNIHRLVDPSNLLAYESFAEVIGLATEFDLSVRLYDPATGDDYGPNQRLVYPDPDDDPDTTFHVETYNPTLDDYTTVDEDLYTVDPHSHRIVFDKDDASYQHSDAMYGRPIWVTYKYADATDPTNTTQVTRQLQIIPEIVRFQYMPGFIRLRHNFVHFDPADPTYNPIITLPNAIAETDRTQCVGGQVAEIPLNSADFDLPDDLPGGTSWASALTRGILDVRGLRMELGGLSNMPLQPGDEIKVSYYYYDSETGQTRRAEETHQIPHNIGESNSQPAMGGAAVYLGVEGYDANRDHLLEPVESQHAGYAWKPFLTGNSIRSSLFSLLWNPVEGTVQGSMNQSAIPHSASYSGLGVPSVSSGIALGDKHVFVGSKMATQIPSVGEGGGVSAYLHEGVGFFSAMKADSTLICDDTRIIEVVGQEPVWTCHGTLSAMAGESVDVQRTIDDRVPVPFNRPAMAEPLPNGNILVVDTGNNRVVEIDRRGVLQWPLTENGYDFYSARGETPNDNPLNLDGPSDAFRYYTIEDPNNPGTYYNSENGDLLLNTTMHTVIADPGHGRMIDVLTWLDANGDQHHEVRTLTPSHVKLTSGASSMQKIAYSAVEPVFDPNNTAVIGYLCGASNLHQLMVVEAQTQRINPPSDAEPPNGTSGSDWKWLAWLWDADVNDTTYGPSDSLIFRSIRDMDLTYEGDFAYVTVTCGQYAGRLSNIQQGRPNALAQQGDGVFEFCMNLSGGPGSWALQPAVDGGGTPVPNTPMWYMTRRDYLYSFPASETRRHLSNIRYEDVDGNTYWQTLPWFPVSAGRVPSDSRPIDSDGDGTQERYFKHMVVNHAGLIANLTRRNVPDTSAPALLHSSVMTVTTDDVNDDNPDNDRLDIDRRAVIPDPNGPDWTDPLAQPTDASK